MKKRIVSIILAVIMIVGMLPLSAIPAMAADGAVARITEYSANGTLTFTYNSVEELNAALEAGRKGTDDKNGKFHGIKLEFFTDMTVSALDYSGNHARLEIELNHHTVKVSDSRNYRSQYIRIIGGTLDFCGESAAHNTDIFKLTQVSDFCSKNGIQLENVVFQNIATEKALTETSSSNSGRLFNITDVGSDGGETLIIRDVTVKDGSFGDDGGAFNINKSKANPSVLFENCQFINLSSKGDGGAIQIENMVGASGKGASLGLKNCNFINCSAESEGGAIYIYEMNGSSSNRASVNLDGCNFSNCTAEDDGGAIFVDDENIDIGNNDNPDDDAHKTLFINCSAQYGGAIFDDNGKNLFKNMIFIGNKATDDEWGGGAMHIFGDDTAVENCEFYLNEGAGYGGAVSIDADDASFKNCVFAANESDKGKDIYIGSNKNAPSITGCTVYGYDSVNSLRRGSKGIGDAAKNTFNASVMRFSDASNYNEYGALIKGDSRENPVLLTNADDMIALVVNVKLDYGTYGDRFYKLDSDIHNVCIFIEDFIGNFIYDGHTLTTRLADIPYYEADGAAARITEYAANGAVTYSYGSTKETTAALKAGRKGNDTDNGKFYGIKLEIFTDMALSELDYSGNHAVLEVDLHGHTLTLNSTRNYTSQYIAIANGTVDFCCDRMTHDGSVFNFSQINSTYIKSGLSLNNVTFQNVKAKRLFSVTDVGISGGNIWNVENVTVKNGTFSENGGAFYINKSKADPSISFTGCHFINLSSTADGGAIYIKNMVGTSKKGAALDLKDCHFINCSVEGEDREGGAIYVYEMNGTSSKRASVNMDGCNFLYCATKNNDGGAIFIDDEYIDFGNSEDPDDYAHKTLFNNCRAEYGGAIYDDNGDNTFRNMIFTQNKATDDEWGGGAMHIYGDDDAVIDCEFYLNSGAGYGGAVSIDADDASFENCIFAGNESDKGKDIYVGSNMDAPSITGCTVYGYDSVNSLRRGSKGIGDAAKNTFNTSVMRFYDHNNYGSGDTPETGFSHDDPVIIKNPGDMIALAVNVKLDSKTYGRRFYKLDGNIENVIASVDNFTGEFDFDGHTVETRLVDALFDKGATVIDAKISDALEREQQQVSEPVAETGDCTTPGHIVYYVGLSDGLYYQDADCTMKIGDDAALEKWTSAGGRGYLVSRHIDFDENGKCDLCQKDLYTYLDYHLGNDAFVKRYIAVEDVTVLTNSSSNLSLGSGWYIAKGDVEVKGNVLTSGDMFLILADGCELTVQGIGATGSLAVFAQSTDEDTMGAMDSEASWQYGGIAANGDIVINGGNITAKGRNGSCAPGIGGSANGHFSAGSITINGGKIEANGTVGGAGIGSGHDSCGNITINGGTIKATGGADAGELSADGGGAGIGCGGCGIRVSCGDITINGGDIEAKGRDCVLLRNNAGVAVERGGGAGIGSSFIFSSCGNITINGGTINADSGHGAAGIGSGSGSSSSCKNITINGGTIEAKGGDGTHGIGNGNSGTCGAVNFHPLISVETDSDEAKVTPAGLNGRAPTCEDIGYKKIYQFDGTYFDNEFRVIGDERDLQKWRLTDWELPTVAHISTDGDEKCDLCGLGGFNIPYYEYSVDKANNSLKEAVIKYADRTQLIDASTTNFNLPEGWYYVTESVTVDKRIRFTGDAHLILAENVTLTANKGITAGTSLTICVQSLDPDTTGKLIAYAPFFDSAIGADSDTNCGDIVIHGGIITAESGHGAAGIGDSCGNITIYSGTVTATGGEEGAGIGSGRDGSCRNITIYGGTVTATGGMGGGAGIGAGRYGSCGDINIYDGTITAKGGVDTEILWQHNEELQVAGIGRGAYGSVYGKNVKVSINNPFLKITAGNDEASAVEVPAYGMQVYVKITEPDSIAEKAPTCIAFGHKAAYRNPADGLYYVEKTYQTKIGDYNELIIWQTKGNGLLPLGAHSCTWQKTKAPTCTENGVESYICSVCGTTTDTRAIDKLGHTYTWQTTKAPTCTEDGEESYICSRCGEATDTRAIEKLGHTCTWQTTKAPTDTEEGEKSYICSRCGETIDTKPVPALGVIEYYDFDENNKEFISKQYSGPISVILNSYDGHALDSGWYYIMGDNVTVQNRIILSGDVHFILADGCRLTAKQGIQVGSSFTVYAQSADAEKMGKITAFGIEDYAGIGAGEDNSCGNITINGGAVTATGGLYAAGIGSGSRVGCGIITINGGVVKATGGGQGAGIGSGCLGSCVIVTINGGVVTATGGEYGAGIGSGLRGGCENITINGGEVTATGSVRGAGIGAGQAGTCGTVTISDYLDITAGADKNSAQSVTVYNGEKYVQLTESDRKTQGKGALLSSTFSGGNLWLIGGIAAAVIIGVAAYVVVKKKKKTATANGAEKEDEK